MPDVYKRQALLEERLVLISAGANVIRFVPPLVIEKSHVDLMIERLENIFEKMSLSSETDMV